MGCVKLLFFMLYTFLCQLAFSSSLPHLCSKDEALALLQFKNMFTIDPNASYYCYDYTDQRMQSYPRTLSWNTSTDCCSWDGVHCEKTTGHVIKLNLTCSGLQGKFHSNSSLFQLSNLKKLDLSYNNFIGSLISPKFGEFSSLTHLDLSGSNFAGLIPAEISHLSKLHVLSIWTPSDGLYDELSLGPHIFELLLKNFTQLRDLHLRHVKISSSIPLNFSSFLTTLRLPYTQLRGVLPERVFHLSNLELLDLSDNPHLTISFPTTKWNSSASLRKLYIRFVNFIGRIPESFSHLTSLLELDLSRTFLSATIPKPIWNLTDIEYLYLGYNNLEGLISEYLIFRKLKELSLRNNNFDGQLEFLSFNRSWMQLEWLEFSSNSLTGPIPSNVSGLRNLQSIYLSSNHLNGSIPSWIFSLPSLIGLDLSNNTFSGKIQEFKSKTIGILTLGKNQLEGPIASAICNLKILIVLDLRNNNLEGTIPQCLGEMSELEDLDLSKNSLSGTINTTFSIGNHLTVISLHGNKLEGKVPLSLINCKNLQILDLGNNELNDTFPKWLGVLPDLQILRLRSNKLHGTVNVSRTENLFAKIRVIDLSSNGFSGNLPVSFFENFEAMKINDEKNGTQKYVADTYSYYYKNSLIVTTKGRDNELPRVSTTQIIIDLSINRFKGQIPSIIGDLIGLRVLNLSHNVLEGHIPASLQKLSVLESLDLSCNKIGGEIPQQLASLTFLEVLNLSNNHLVGCIPKGKQFDTFENNSYLGNDGLRGLPPSRDCGRDNRIAQATIPVELDQEEEEEEEEEDDDSPMINWQAVLMGYGCGLVIGLSIIYIMLSTQYPAWLSRIVVKLEHKISTRTKKHNKRY